MSTNQFQANKFEQSVNTLISKIDTSLSFLQELQEKATTPEEREKYTKEIQIYTERKKQAIGVSHRHILENTLTKIYTQIETYQKKYSPTNTTSHHTPNTNLEAALPG